MSRASAANADEQLSVEMSGQMMPYDWLINGRRFADATPMTVRQGQWATIKADGTPGPRKDTVVVLPMQKLTSTWSRIIPGMWMLHCHNTYHLESGMMTSLDYIG